MRNILLSASTAALMLVGAAAANAADLPPPPMPEPANWNFTVFGGMSWLDGVDTEVRTDIGDFNADFDFDTGYLIGGAMGFTFVDWARTEIEVAYAGYDVGDIKVSEDGVSGKDTYNRVDADFGVLTVMGNMWFGFNMLPLVGGTVDSAGTGMGVSPYFGGGIGVGFVDNSGSDADSFDFDDSTTGLAWQVGAGVRFNFVSNLGFDLGYRYRNVTDVGMGDWDEVDFASHNFVVGLSFNF